MIWKPHATVAAIIEKNGHFLMVEEDSDGQIVFNQPAGHLDPGESFIEAVIRETREETAWQLHPEAIIGLYRWQHPNLNRTYTRIAFSGQCDNHDPDQILDQGIIRAVWMTREELLSIPDKLRSPMVIRCIDDYLAGKRYPLELLVDL